VAPSPPKEMEHAKTESGVEHAKTESGVEHAKTESGAKLGPIVNLKS